MKKCQVISCGHDKGPIPISKIGATKAIAVYQSVGATAIFYACKSCVDKFKPSSGITFEKIKRYVKQ